MKIKKNTFSTLVLELFYPLIANGRKFKVQKIQKSTSSIVHCSFKLRLATCFALTYQTGLSIPMVQGLRKKNFFHHLMSMTMSRRNQKAEVPRMILIVRALTRHIMVLRLGQGVGFTTLRLWKGKRGTPGLRRP
jgi:hypothetical protein